MSRTLPKFVLYLLCWTGLWIVITVVTQMPECYQRSNALDAGTPSAIYRDLGEFAEYRALLEIPFGLLWGSVSWGLQFGGISVLRRFPVPKLLQAKGVTSPSFVWPTITATILVSLLEGAVFGLPAAALNTSFANFDLVSDDMPSVTINTQSIAIEAAGIVLAFVLPTLIAGCVTSRSTGLRRKIAR
ncbi:MAG: hypothetical protein ACRYFS_17185 [Janthinobacterium lividum]